MQHSYFSTMNETMTMKRTINETSDKNNSMKHNKSIKKNDQDEVVEKRTHSMIQFCSESGEEVGPPLELPHFLTRDKLQSILNSSALLNQENSTPYSFFIDDHEITENLDTIVSKLKIGEEKCVKILYQPQAVFRVSAVTRCTSSLPGHSEAVLHASFSPDGQHLATASGDTTVRFWDVNTETPHHTCKGHKHWVLMTAWSPDGLKLASACKKGHVMIWNPETGNQMGRTLIGHKQWVTALSWEPLHLCATNECIKLASASKDGDIRIWDTRLGQCIKVLSNHQKCVTALRWGGEGKIYSASQDKTINMWRASDGILCKKLQGHGHWVNSLALNTDYVIRTGAADPQKIIRAAPQYPTEKDRVSEARRRYQEALCIVGEEVLVSGSDDFTLFLWKPTNMKTPIERMVGHRQLVNDVKFSPDTRLIASGSFDRTIRIWNGSNGKCLGVLRGHVAGVYQIAWSADSRLLISGSKDSTLKVWNVKTCKLDVDLPGHADEVYAVDWSPDGARAVSGGKDKVVRIWRR